MIILRKLFSTSDLDPIWYRDGIHLYKDGEKIDDIIEVIPKNKLQGLQKACDSAGKDCWKDMKSFLGKHTTENNFIRDFKVWGINVHTGKIPGIEIYGKSSLQGLKPCLFFGEYDMLGIHRGKWGSNS